MSALSNAPLKKKEDLENFPDSIFKGIYPYLEKHTAAILLLNIPSGSGQTSCLNDIYHRVSTRISECSEQGEFSSYYCARYSCLNKTSSGDWRTVIASSLYLQITSDETNQRKTYSNPLKSNFKFGEFLVDNFWADIRQERMGTVSYTHLTLPTTPYV